MENKISSFLTKSLDNQKQISTLSMKSGNLFINDFSKESAGKDHRLNRVKDSAFLGLGMGLGMGLDPDQNLDRNF